MLYYRIVAEGGFESALSNLTIDAHIHYTPPALGAALPALAESEPFMSLLLRPGALEWGEPTAGPGGVKGPARGGCDPLRGPAGSDARAGEGGDPPGERAGPASASGAPARERSTALELQDWVEGPRLIDDMDRAGLDRAIVMGYYWQKHEMCVAQNSEALELVRRWPGRLLAFATVQPKAGQAALDELARCLDGGMCGAGELGPYGQGCSMEDPDFLRLAEACTLRGVPLNLHVSEEVGHFYAGKSATPLAAFYRLACLFPELDIILAHWGGGLFFYEMMPEVRRRLRRVWYDTAASPLLYPTPAVFRAALACVDPAKILYGSDYPLRICPRAQAGADFRPFLGQIDALNLPPAVRAGIMGGNAARLLGRQAGGDRGGREAPGELRQAGPRPDFMPASPQGGAEVALAAGPAPEGDTRPGVPASRPGAALWPGEGSPARVVRGASELGPQGGPGLRAPGRERVSASLPVCAAAEAWPATRAVFDAHGIPWQEGAAPSWEPIRQAAAAHGLGGAALERLLAELAEAAGEA